MIIAIVTPYWPPVRGGVTTFVVGLSQELRRASGAEVHVIAREGRAAGATVIGGTPREFMARSIVELEQIRPDVIHAHGHWYALQCAHRFRRRSPSTRIVFTLHTEFPPSSVLGIYALRRMLSHTDVVTALSRDLLDRTIRRIGFRSKAEIVPPGVNMTRAPMEQIAAFLRGANLERCRPLVGFLGPMAHRQKAEGVARLIEAMPRLRAAVPGTTLAIGGDGPYRPPLEALAARTVPTGARFLGSVESPAIFLSALDIYAHISLQEGFGLAILEAMACGTPVVAANVGGIPELVRSQDNGLLVSSDPREIADTLASLLLSRDAARRLSERALEEVAERYTWRRAAGRFLELYSM